jgi:hypothetical protein
MYTAERYLDTNYITSVDMIAAGSQAGGIVSGVEKTRGTGSAAAFAAGSFAGAQNLDYIAQIDSITPGVSVGQATYRWKTSESSGWEATGVTTLTTLATLNYGVKIAWQAGVGDDFTLEDTFQFFAVAKYGAGNLLNLNPNSLFRSGATFPIVIDLGSAQQVTAFALMNHNLVAGQSTLTLQANSSDSWGSPAYSQAITVTDHKLIFYLDQTYRYWRIVPVDGALSYFQTATLYLGSYRELEANAWWTSSRGYGYTGAESENPAGMFRHKAYAQQADLLLHYDVQSLNDIASLAAMQAAVVDIVTSGKIHPLYVHLFYDEPETFFLCDWRNIRDFRQQFAGVDFHGAVDLHFKECVKTRI